MTVMDIRDVIVLHYCGRLYVLLFPSRVHPQDHVCPLMAKKGNNVHDIHDNED